jgi:SAM-dependent methyltransferase
MPLPLRFMPRTLQSYVLHFEAAIEAAVREFAASLPPKTRVLDAGAGEGQYAELFRAHRYFGVDLGIGDKEWSYQELDAVADLRALPFGSDTFDACVNVVTLEHVPEPTRVIGELYRTLKPGGRLLLITPHEWEEHQQPHDYFRYTQYGLAYMLGRCGFEVIAINPVGGFFRLLARRLLNGIQFFPGPVAILAACVFVPPALVLPMLDRLDTRKNFTLGHICTVRKPWHAGGLPAERS